MSKCTPQEELANELVWYLNFEAAPMEMEEGEEGSGDEPSAQQVLLNPLVWWKVHDFIPHLYHFNKLGFRYMLLNSLPLLGWPRTILPFLQLVSRSSETSQNPDTFVAIYAAL